MLYTLSGLVEYARCFVAENLSGFSVAEVTIHLVDARGETRPFPVPVAVLPPGFPVPARVAGTLNTAEPIPEAGERGKGPMLPPCVKDILATLRDHNKPLTKLRLLEEMGKRGFEWGETTVTKYLHDLMEDGTIENPANGKPRGYRMADE